MRRNLTRRLKMWRKSDVGLVYGDRGIISYDHGDSRINVLIYD